MLNSKTLFLKFPFKADRNTIFLSKGITKKKYGESMSAYSSLPVL